MALTVSYLGCVITTIWIGVCHSPIMEAALARLRLKTDIETFATYTSEWPNFGFSRTTALLTAWISQDRCLLVTFPSRVKVTFPPVVTKVVLVLIYAIGLCPLVSAYIGVKLDSSFDPGDNRTAVQLYLNDSRNLKAANRIAYYQYGPVYALLSWIVVVICAASLISTPRQSSRRTLTHTRIMSNRAQETGAGAGHSNQSNRERRVTRTLVLLACVFFLFILPISLTVSGAAIGREELSLTGTKRSLFLITAFVSFLFSELNSSLNIVVYALNGSSVRSSLY